MGKRRANTGQVTQAAVLAWLVPGAGHYLLGHRGLAAVFFVAITFSYWTGVAVGGVKTSVDPQENRWLFLAELGIGSYTAGCLAWSNALPTYPPDEPSPYVSYYPESDVAQIYLAVAGLLNVLAILDAMTRAQTGGLPVFYPELPGAAPSDTPGGPTAP